MDSTRLQRGVCLLALVAALWGYAGCTKPSTLVPQPFPASNDVAGWSKTADARVFSATELWNYIDGDAERYVKAGVQSTSTADYRFRDLSDAVVDVYTMGSPEGARAIFESEPAGESTTAAIGDGARVYSASVVFREGPYLVRIVAYKASPELRSALQDLAREVEKRLAR